MLYRKILKTGDELSILGFGCMRLTMKDGKIDEERAGAQVRHAIGHGVNYLDTAWPYHAGASEPFAGGLLSQAHTSGGGGRHAREPANAYLRFFRFEDLAIFRFFLSAFFFLAGLLNCRGFADRVGSHDPALPPKNDHRPMIS